MGFGDFWNDLWDGGGIGKKGKPVNLANISANPMAAPNKIANTSREQKKSDFAQKNYKRPTSSGYKGKPTPPKSDFQVRNYKRPTSSGWKGKEIANREYQERLAQQQQQSQMMQDDALINDLIEKIKSGGDGGAGANQENALRILQEAFDSNLGALNGVRTSARNNFNESDRNLEAMHRVFQQDTATKGADAFRGITKEHINSVENTTNQGTNRLAAMAKQQQAERQAMLRNLGIEAAGAVESTEDDPLMSSIGAIEKRGASQKNMAQGIGSANLARNQGMATAIGREGLERRSDLRQQLDSIMNGLTREEAGARNQFSSQKAQMQLEFSKQNQERAQMEIESAKEMLDQIYQQRLSQVETAEEAQAEQLAHQRALEKIDREAYNRGILDDRKNQNRVNFETQFPRE